MGRRRRALPLITALLLLVTATGMAVAADFPDLNAGELKAKLDSGETMILLNPLSDIEFNEQHIPGSINIPLHTIASTDKLPQDKTTLIVTYCLGPK